MQPREVRHIARRSRTIDGWFSSHAAGLFGLLDAAQDHADVSGHLFEIGVHHGKSAVLLAALASPTERLGVCDLFGSQDENISASGSGDRAVFESNLARFAADFDRIDVFEMSSGELKAEALPQPIRFFHIDGGHLAEEALGDLQLAKSVLAPRGVIVVDDPWRPEWPGVTEAILAFLRANDEFRPVMMGFNKLVLCSADSLPLYDEYARQFAWKYFPGTAFAWKTIPVAGWDTIVFHIPVRRQLPGVEVRIAQIREVATRLRDRRQMAGTLVRRVTRASEG